MQVTVAGTGSTDATIAWQPSSAPDVAGYRIYYREPGSGTTFVADVPHGQQTSYVQQGLYLDGGWDISISAYDLNDNESTRSTSVLANIDMEGGGTLYLPLIVR